MPRDGWLKREFAAVEREVASWPRWMRSESNGEKERIYLAKPISRSGAVDRIFVSTKTHPVIGIIAFTPREAREKIIGYCASRGSGEASPCSWRIFALRALPEVKGVSPYQAAQVLAHAGINVLFIEEERTGHARPIKRKIK